MSSSNNHNNISRQIPWNNRLDYTSKANSQFHQSYRVYFESNPPPSIAGVASIPRHPALKQLISASNQFYQHTRDPRYYNPLIEAAWDNRAGIEAAKLNHQQHIYRKYYDGGLNAVEGEFPSSSFTAVNQRVDSDTSQSLPAIEKLKLKQLPQVPAIVLTPQGPQTTVLTLPPNQIINGRVPQYRYDYLKKHIRAPLSPFLSSVTGFDVPENYI